LPQDPAPLPLLVFIHGFGGSVAQFHPLLTSLSNNASCLAIDLPGCGRSEFAPQDWDAYSTDALVELLEVIIEDHRDKKHNQGVILIGHSMGTVLAARLANQGAPHITEIASHVMGLVGICPLSGMSPKEVSGFRNLLRIPTWIVNIFRWWDQIGGPHSASVTRFVGPDADLGTRQLQARYNKQSRTAVFRRMCWGTLPKSFDGDKPIGGLFGEPTWVGLNVPVFLIGAEKDTITPKSHIEKICRYLQSDKESIASNASNSSATIGESAAPVAVTQMPSEHLPQSIDAITERDFERRKPSTTSEEIFEDPTTPRDPADAPAAIPPQPLHPEMVVKTKIIPAPANHAALYSNGTVRTLSGLVCDFIVENITGRLDFGWQLQHLNREGKWEVKNLEKWKAVQPVSDSINGIFRAMKTLREVDEEHSPKQFTAKWNYLIKDIIDISKDNPAYDPLGLERNGIKYHKFPTVSKKPPNDAEVAGFIELVSKAVY
jgi:pimeloyl-ACP methyl ester carboxylesterase